MMAGAGLEVPWHGTGEAQATRFLWHAQVKGASQVAGRATVCIFPTLDTGNNTYKVRTQAPSQ